MPRLVELMREQLVEDMAVTVGGTIPADVQKLTKKLGVADVFTPGADDRVDQRVPPRVALGFAQEPRDS